MLQITQEFKQKYPDAFAGWLIIRNARNLASHPQLEESKRQLEEELRARYAGMDAHAMAAIPTLAAYADYYRRYDKTYHVQGQLVSIVHKGKSIPSVATLVEAMFMAELKNGLLTAGSDLDQTQPPYTLDVATGAEQYTLMRGTAQALKPGDMYIADASGVLSSILYGPDQRSQIGVETRNVLYTVYAPKGISAESVQHHLEELRDLVQLVCPDAITESLEVVGSSIA